ncbi:MAG: outer membrane protein assembly factor BamA [Candidatus Pelagibacter bacterium]|nr:outer membrane protein assembly factor BamA [Candidatus Pelagibacter bacterium]MBL6861147.1 outer membrane protein assembly factor BamA [Candidatus Pelagibacter bacterium]
MKKIISLFFLFFLFFNSIKAEIVKEILINGNERVSKETIKIYGNIKVGEDINEKKINVILRDLYETNFFKEVEVKLEKNVLKVNVNEYPVINQLIIIGEPSEKTIKAMKENISLKEKNSFIKSNLSNDIETIKKLYSSVGYNFVNVEAKFNEVDSNNIDLIFEISKGGQTKISSITFIGDKKIKSKRLYDVVASEEDKFWKFLTKNTRFSKSLLDLDLRLLKNYYKSLGYYDVNITSNIAELNKSGNFDLIYSIDAGERFIVNKITTNLDPTFDKNLFLELEEEYAKYVGDYYSPFKIKKMLDSLDKIIEENNIQFVEHNVEELIEGNEIAIKLNIFEGEKLLVERINIIGNEVTNEDVIRGEVILDEGDPFTKIGLDKSIANIKSRNIFRNVVSNVKSGPEDNLKIIDISVEEMPTGEISAGAGVGTNGGSLAFQVSENNWLGEGKKVNFSLDTDEESLQGRLNFSDPNYNFLGNAIGYSLYSVSNDKPNQGYENTLVGAGVNTRFEQYKDIFLKLGLAVNYDELRTDGSASSALQKQKGEFTELVANYGFDYDQRDRSFMPTSGSIVGFSQSIPFYADKNYISNVFTLSKYMTLNENIVIANKYFVSTIDGFNDEDVRLNKRSFLSSKRLRGFKKGKVGPKDGDDYIGGNYAAAMNLEMNLPKLLPDSTNLDVGLFLDFGNVWGVDYDNSIPNSNKIRSTTGFVANYSSPIGPLSFTFSQNLRKADTDQTEGFNFNLGTTF